MAPVLGACGVEDEDFDDPEGEELGVAADAISGGYTDTTTSAVVGVVTTDESGYLSRTCSGTLIAPNLVLTAQHCVADTSKFVSCSDSQFGPVAPAGQVFITTDASMWASGTVWRAAIEVLAPPGEAFVCGRDVALIMLASNVSPADATPSPPRLAHAPITGEPYSAVGYGHSAYKAGDAGLRRRRDNLLVVCVGAGCGAQGQVELGEWRGDTGICNGDSGGPALDAEQRVIGVTSRGPVGCHDPIYGGLSVFAPWIATEGLRAAALGGYPPGDWATDEPGTGSAASRVRPAPVPACALQVVGEPDRGAGLLGLAGLVAAAGLAGARSRRRATRNT